MDIETLFDEVMEEELQTPGTRTIIAVERKRKANNLDKSFKIWVIVSQTFRIPLTVTRKLSVGGTNNYTSPQYEDKEDECVEITYSLPTEDLVHPRCMVCGGRAGRHNYYGGQACPSCRAFFRRTVQAGGMQTHHTCKQVGKCEVTQTTRRKCQPCRYKKCIGAGMRPTWILSSQERQRRFHGHEREENRKDLDPTAKVSNEKSFKINYAKLSTNLEDVSENISDEDILSYSEIMKSRCTGLKDDLCKQMVTELLQVSMQGLSLSQHTAVTLSTIVDHRTIQSVQLLPEYQDLCTHDQSQILFNIPIVHRFRQAFWWSCKVRISWVLEMLMGDTKDFQNDVMPESLMTRISTEKEFKYDSLFTSPWCPSADIEEKHKKLMKEIAESIDSGDMIEVILIVLIILFNPDFLDLDDKKKVEIIQLKFVLALHAHYKKESFSDAGSRLARSLMIPTLARPIFHLTLGRLSL